MCVLLKTNQVDLFLRSFQRFIKPIETYLGQKHKLFVK